MIKEYLKITDDREEMRSIAKRLVRDITNNVNGEIKPFYTQRMLDKMDKEIIGYFPGLSNDEIEALRYQFIYDYWVFGCTVDEEFFLRLKDKTAAEKQEYMFRRLRVIYINHMNSNAGPDRKEKLSDKYRLYQILKPYYKRDVIQVCSMDDIDEFTAFAEKHRDFVVKPADLYSGIGVYKFSMDGFGDNYTAALESILNEALNVHEMHPSKGIGVVLEELIVQDEALAAFHSNSVNGIRATAIRGKDGRVTVYHPWIKVGARGEFVASAAQNGFDAEIDSRTGVVCSHGYSENGQVCKVHPDSNIQIKGYQIPKWDELIEFVNEIMDKMTGYRDIGWDLVLTPKGWCVIEGNYSGEFMFQLINGRGYKREYEELIGWQFDKDFWWEAHKQFKHN